MKENVAFCLEKLTMVEDFEFRDGNGAVLGELNLTHEGVIFLPLTTFFHFQFTPSFPHRSIP